MNPSILYEDNHLLVLNKPARMVSQGALPGEPSLVEWAKEYLKRKYDKPGNVYVGVVSRLDRDVSGVIVLARTSKGAARLNEQFRERTVEKIYWACVSSKNKVPDAARCEDWIAEDESVGRMTIVERGRLPSGKNVQADLAALEFKTLERRDGRALLEIKLETGRKHQIRVQLSARDMPINGDRRYGSREKFAEGIALHARRIVFRHPTRDEVLTLEAPCPVAWRELGFQSLYESQGRGEKP